MTCVPCKAAWGDLPDGACDTHTEDVIALAHAMGYAAHKTFMSDEKVGWFMEDAAAAVEYRDEFPQLVPPWTVEVMEGSQHPPRDIIAINGVRFFVDLMAEGFNTIRPLDGTVEFVECDNCGEEQADMGRNVACENCGYGPMPSGSYEPDV